MPRKDIMISFLVKHFGLTREDNILKIINRDESFKKELENKLNTKIPEGLDLTSIPDIENENFKYQEKN